nr:unnamed protein product [Digitaria exilis]
MDCATAAADQLRLPQIFRLAAPPPNRLLPRIPTIDAALSPRRRHRFPLPVSIAAICASLSSSPSPSPSPLSTSKLPSQPLSKLPQEEGSHRRTGPRRQHRRRHHPERRRSSSNQTRTPSCRLPVAASSSPPPTSAGPVPLGELPLPLQPRRHPWRAPHRANLLQN